MLVKYANITDTFQTITLEEMSSIRLMNRIDSKYLATGEQLLELLNLAQREYFVQSVCGSRIREYSTVYFDNDEDIMYLEHHNGRLTRQKVRIRSYLDTNLHFFEIKLKNNHGRTKKKRIQIDSPDSYVENGAGQFLADNAILPIPLEGLSRKVVNHFNRITLVNYDRTERLTIDFSLSFHNFETGIDRDMKDLVVIEVKRDSNMCSPIVDILRDLRIHPSGFSKYCIGMALTKPGIKRGRFNERIRKIEKLTHYDNA